MSNFANRPRLGRLFCAVRPRSSAELGRLALAGLLGTLAALAGCKHSVPEPSSKRYDAFVSAFYTGLAGLQVGDDVRAETGLAEAVALAPGEPAAWVNWGVLALRQRSYEQAADRLGHAHSLAPHNGQIDYLLGLLESERGNSAAAIPHLEDAVQAEPKNLRALYQLASEIERQGDASSDQRFEQLMQQILAAAPGNLAAELELSRIAAKRGDVEGLRRAVQQITAQASGWPPEVEQQLAQLQAAAAGDVPRSAATRSIFLRNVLMRVPSFRDSLADLRPQPGEGAQPMMRLVTMQNPPSRPAAADTALTFVSQADAGLTGAQASTWAGAIILAGDAAPVLAAADGKELRLASGATFAFPGGTAQAAALLPEQVLPIDLNYDFKTDLVLAGAAGVRFFRQETPAAFTDVSAATKLPPAVLNGSYTGAWALDIEADGDLDILLGDRSGPPILLRNNGDGTFAVMRPFAGIGGLRQLAWVDLNGDGNPDAAMIDGQGKLHVFLNKRAGLFAESPLPAGLGTVRAIAAADLGSNAGMDTLSLAAVQQDGHLVAVVAGPSASGSSSGAWSIRQLGQARGPLPTGELRLYAADFDNNGAVDLLVGPVTANANSTPSLWLQDANGSFAPLTAAMPGQSIGTVADLKGDGQLALVGLGGDGKLATATARGTRNYHWQTIRPRAKQSTGDQRINSFGIGGEIEIRAGLLVQRQPITTPQLHFGLGEQKQTDVARILWPNGSVRAEFALKANQQVVTEQRLKGSCPFLFAWDGHHMGFVKDSVPWGSAIGLRINALGAARIAATEEWYKIGRDQLVAREGVYDLRVTGELWETYYYDSMQLMAVDHPIGTEIFTDERFDVPPVKLAVTTVSEPQPVARAMDDGGQDVTATVAHLDGDYLDTFGRGQYQGITRDHFVEVDLPPAIDATLASGKPLWLIASGWLHPSDSSINVALGQGSAPKPQWLSLEVQDEAGHWRVAQPNLGFPAGRNKICLIDLNHLFKPGSPHRLRLRTNLEIYWDQLQWAEGRPSTPLAVQRLQPQTADLHYRGFSTIYQANDSSPELPDYDRLSGTGTRWRDLEGYYTRFGDVRELLAAADDRYVIMNAGDEMQLRFAAPAAPPEGWVRDFVLAGNGWIKDGDYNSTYSATVLPYPHHTRRDYDASHGVTAPEILEQDWVYQHHKADWQTYQTRYVTPAGFRHALVSGPAEAKR